MAAPLFFFSFLWSTYPPFLKVLQTPNIGSILTIITNQWGERKAAQSSERYRLNNKRNRKEKARNTLPPQKKSLSIIENKSLITLPPPVEQLWTAPTTTWWEPYYLGSDNGFLGFLESSDPPTGDQALRSACLAQLPPSFHLVDKFFPPPPSPTSSLASASAHGLF